LPRNTLFVELAKGAAELTPEKILSCVFGVSEFEAEVYFKMLEHRDEAPFTVEEVGELIGRSRSTAQKILKSLLSVGLVRRQEETLPGGGRRYLYEPTPWEEVTELGLESLERVYREVKKWFKSYRPAEGEDG